MKYERLHFLMLSKQNNYRHNQGSLDQRIVIKTNWNKKSFCFEI